MKYLSHLLLISILLIACSKKQNDKEKTTINSYYDIAFEYRDKDQTDSAYKYFSEAKDVFLQQNDSLGVAKCLVNMGFISLAKGDYLGAQELSLKALNHFNEKVDSQFVYIESNYNTLGRATYQLQDYHNSIKFYNAAIKFSRNSSDIRIYLNNKAKTYQELKAYDESLKIYRLALQGLKADSKEYAMALTNLTLTKWLQDPNYNAAPSYLVALNIRKKENDLWGQNSSYIHLSEFYAKKQPDAALSYANKAYQVAKTLNSANDQIGALALLIDLSDAKNIKKYFDSYKSLSDSVQNARNTSKNQFALIRYETEKSKADNLMLQKDNTEKKYQIIKREILLYSSLFVLLAGSIVTLIWYNKRKQKIELETQNAIRESRLKTSKKVHDVVANGLYRVMTEIEHTDGLDKEEMLDRLDEMYQKSRDISYEVEETNPIGQNFNAQIAALLQPFNTPTTKVSIKGNTTDLWAKVNVQAKHEIEHVLQELMVNMKKHSQSTEVELSFKQLDHHIRISYTDDGIGMSKRVQYKNGLRNTGNRIEHIRGEITFDTKLEKGLKIVIVFPMV